MTRIPVTLLTGFLGAGKTTLLNRLIAEPGFGDTAVIVNEFGEAGVDGDLVAQSDERAFAMSVGCLCCTVSGDVRLTLLRLLDEAKRGVGPSFDRVVIETTGLADPLPLLQTFMTNNLILETFTLNGVVTVVDAVNGAESIARFPEAQRQVAVADLLVVTKGELTHEPEAARDLDRLKRTLASRNPNAEVVSSAEVNSERVFSLAAFDPAGKPPAVSAWLRFDADHGRDHGHHAHDHHDVNNHGDTASAFCFTAREPIDADAFENAVWALRASLGPNLLRLKGLVDVKGFPDAPRIIHAVGHVLSPMRALNGWPEAPASTKLVLIVGGPGRNAAADAFRKFLPELRPFGEGITDRSC